MTAETAGALGALADGDASIRLRAALAIGMNPAPDTGAVDSLVARCAIEPEFSVREMLTWALTRHDPAATVPRLLPELRSPLAQARSQALHTLSKIGDPRTWASITRDLLLDADDEVARAAWRTAVAFVPEGEECALASVLTTQFARGSRETRLSLSRALIGLGEEVLPALHAAMEDPDPAVRAHAIATEQLYRDPEAGFTLAVEEAKRVVALGPDEVRW
ncbi:HEAT repeat domain-containing protein [Streptomyces sp. NPDC048057]|uniref:HEAT repeat domain-containing protein n=1 Tax=Streptomyces sp. NPDC048057 TaxID=3155628 RepID=UPI0033CFD123